MGSARALGQGGAGRGAGGRGRRSQRLRRRRCKAAAEADGGSPQQPVQSQPSASSLRALATNPLTAAVGASAVTAFVSWLRGVGARGNEMQNLSKSIESLENKLNRQTESLKSDLNRQTESLESNLNRQTASLESNLSEQQATNRNLYSLTVVSISLTVVSVSASVGAFIVALFKGRV